MRQLSADRVGLGWREPLAAQIFAHLDDLEVIEIIAEDYLDGSSRRVRSLKSLGRHRPLLLHGVTLGLASTAGLDDRRVERLARLIGTVEPARWSEHLAFVRAGGCEIGHLAAPPRNRATLDAAVHHLRRISTVVGSLPALENIATLIDPPDSDLSEAAWVGGILGAAGADALLDLHNLYANALNFGHRPRAFLDTFPLARVRMVHLSGGRLIEARDPRSGRCEQRLLDDHLHDVPEAIFDLLERLGEVCLQPLDVIIERDGCFPEFSHLLQQVERARAALMRGRRRAAAREERRELAAL